MCYEVWVTLGKSIKLTTCHFSYAWKWKGAFWWAVHHCWGEMRWQVLSSQEALMVSDNAGKNLQERQPEHLQSDSSSFLNQKNILLVFSFRTCSVAVCFLWTLLWIQLLFQMTNNDTNVNQWNPPACVCGCVELRIKWPSALIWEWIPIEMIICLSFLTACILNCQQCRHGE